MFQFNTAHGARPRRAHHHEMDRGQWSRAGLRDMVDALRVGRAAMRRGDVRPLILRALQRAPMHGYQVIQELEQQSGGRWRPSAGSVYPTLQQLEDEGLVRSAEVDGRRVYSLTEVGRTAATTAPAREPAWFGGEADDASTDIRRLAIQLASAVMQVNRMGTPKARDEARDILVDARRRMYRLLADDLEAGTADVDAPGTAEVAGGDVNPGAGAGA